MDGCLALDFLPKFSGHFRQCLVLVYIASVSADRGDFNTVEACACWRHFLEAPVAMPDLCKDGGLFVSLAFNGDYMIPAVYWPYKGVVSKVSEIQRVSL